MTKLLLLAGLFTGVQSLFALFSAQSFHSQAIAAMDQLNQHISKQTEAWKEQHDYAKTELAEQLRTGQLNVRRHSRLREKHQRL